MAKVPPPPRKGEPPSLENTLGNLDSGDYKHLNFRVPATFHRDFAVFAAMESKSQVDVLYEAFELLKRTRDSKTTD